MANSIGYGILNNVDFIGDCYDFLSATLFTRTRRKSELTTTIQFQLFGRWFNPFIVAKWTRFFFLFIFWDSVHFTLCIDVCWIYIARWYPIFFHSIYFLPSLSLWNFLYSCPPKKPYQMTRRAEQIWKMSFSNGEKPIEKFTWHRHFVMWIEKWNVISIAVAHSTILFRSARALPCFSICSFTTRKFVIWCALFFCAFLRLFFVCISRWVCYLFSPSNYITLRVSICWQRKCILFNARPGEPNWRRAKYERNEWERVSE